MKTDGIFDREGMKKVLALLGGNRNFENVEQGNVESG